jgi:hypothetical protein
MFAFLEFIFLALGAVFAFILIFGFLAVSKKK